MRRPAVLTALALALSLTITAATPVSFDIVYVRAPRYGDTTSTKWPDVFNPVRLEPNADLMLLRPDGTESVLVAGGARGAVTDPFVSFDAQWVFYAHCPDVVSIDGAGHPWTGCDIWKVKISTRERVQLTHGEFTPNTAIQTTPRTGTYNLGPAPLAGGRVVFTSSRNGFNPTKPYSWPTMQLYVMDEDGANVMPIAPMTLGSALHPMPLKDGRIAFSSYESQGLRDWRVWGLWAIWPDGRHWEPLISAYQGGNAFHFAAQVSNSDLVIEDYYNLNNNGFGNLYRFPTNVPAPSFGSAFASGNPSIPFTTEDYPYSFWMPFTPKGLITLAPWTTHWDAAAPIGPTGARVGKFTMPSGAPNNDLLVVWTPGPANNLNRPTNLPQYDGGLYVMRNSGPTAGPSDLVLIKNDPAYNEQWPRAVVPYSAIYGVAAPQDIPWLPSDGTRDSALPAGTPYGIVGTASLYNRESFPGFAVPWANFDGLDIFNSDLNDTTSNWGRQGADAGKYSNADIYAIRIVALEPTSFNVAPHNGIQAPPWYNHATERMRILGEIPVRKGALLDPQGNPDTSFRAKIPADTPFTFQLLDRNGMLLAAAQTWHQVRPGEIRTDCGGCHAHSKAPVPFEQTAAASQAATDLTAGALVLSGTGTRQLTSPLDVEFIRDVRPILQRTCVPCHRGPDAPGQLQLDDLALYPASAHFEYQIALPGDYARLARDAGARWGYKPVNNNVQWRDTNASRYVRMFQSRRSLLAWKIFGRRLDGWTNTDHPTEITPGNRSTLPAGADHNLVDIDYTGEMMPPPGSGFALTEDEKLTIVRWIDLGAPINLGAKGWFADELRPTLTVASPRPNATTFNEIRIGVADYYSGVDWSSLSVVATVALGPQAAGTNLAGLGTTTDGVWTLPVTPPTTGGTLVVRVRDRAGNWNEQPVRFGSGGVVEPPPPPPPPPDLVPSPDNTSVPPASQIVDAQLNVWTIGAPNIILRNGTQAANGLGSEIFWHSGVIYVFGTDSNWWQWTGSAWTNIGPTRPGIVVQPPSDTTPPTVQLTSVTRKGNSANYSVRATATDNVGIARVEFLVDGVVRTTDTSPTYEQTVSIPQGTHTVGVRAVDRAGLTSSVATRIVTR